MNIKSLKIAFFSPTGTTKSVVQAIARGMNPSASEFIDLTKPEARKRSLAISANELLMVAVPVYIGRVPALLSDWLHSIKADQTPTVCVVVFGNREFEDALLELKDVIKERGGIPIAGAAFIGEHSFSGSDTPIALARPDAADLSKAEEFGRKISQILQSISSIDTLADLRVSGNFPYRQFVGTLSPDFMAISDQCTQCGLCAEACPVEAIDFEDSHVLDKEKCIFCCACIKVCPENARTMVPSQVKDLAVRLSETCKEPKEPVFFF